VRRVLTRCLRKDPNTRLRDIGDARLDLTEGDGVPPIATVVARRTSMPLVAMTVIAAAAIAAAAWLWLRNPAPPAPRRWSAVLVGGPPTVMQPALSPDGQLLAFLVAGIAGWVPARRGLARADSDRTGATIHIK
jgi:hypothetical protein